MTPDVAIAPYRVEWRPDLTTRWLLIDHRFKREDADALAVETLERHNGYCRLISQHVVGASRSPGHWVSAP